MEKVSKDMMQKLDYIRAHKLEYGTRPLSFLDDVEGDGCIEISEWYWGQVDLADAQFKLIEHVFGDTPQFEEQPKKYIVRYKEIDEDGDHWFVRVIKIQAGIKIVDSSCGIKLATKFDTREEAEKWTNPQAEVIEVEY